MPTLTLSHRPSGYWIEGLPDLDCPESGPYSTKAEAEDDRRGLVRFYRTENDRSAFTSEPLKTKV